MTHRSWTPDDHLEQEVKDQFDRAIASYRANPHLISEHANHEESIRVGGYAHRTLLELVQNSADAMSGAEDDRGDTAGRVEIVLDQENHVLYCANAGRPFSKDGLTAIAHAHLSGKRGDEIGRFGLGFKSVLAVSDNPQVFSRSVSFEFNSPAARAAIADLGSTARRQPILRTATLLDPVATFAEDPILAELSDWATTVVRLPRASSLDRLRQEITGFSSEFLLFVGAVREIKLRVLGADAYATSHRSRDLGDSVLTIERPDGSGDEWVVLNRMHAPSPEARRQVGEAVSRTEVKVTVAIPKRHSRQRIGRFWSYFPLQDQTSASALFNAPWSVNDDRTTLLRNDYNREMLTTLSDLFVEALPRLSTSDDPAQHLDYMPARGRELLSFGDEVLCAHIPRTAAPLEIVPDATGALSRVADLCPPDFGIAVDPTTQQQWTASPNTGNDVPHWRCYTSPQRVARLRDLVTAAVSTGLADGENDTKRALEKAPKRTLLAWLREWAEGDDVASAVHAFKFVCTHLNLPDIDKAKVIPTTDGMRAVRDKNIVFLEQVDGVEIESAVFVSPEFLARPGVLNHLNKLGFRDLDPLAILNARLASVTSTATGEQLTKLWDAVLELPPREAMRALAAHSVKVQVPTRDGGWAWPSSTLDIEEPLGPDFAAITLDRKRCLPEVAHHLGVVHGPVKNHATEDEPYFGQYREWILTTLNAARGAGDRPIERVDFDLDRGPGPFSVLLMLRDAGASEESRSHWTERLLAFGDAAWRCEDLDTGKIHSVSSPLRWAVDQAGLVRSTRGIRRPADVVAPSLLRYTAFLPLFKGPTQVATALGLPNELDAVPDRLIKEALDAELFRPDVDDAVLVDFITAACRIAYRDIQPPTVPARVKRAIEARVPSSVFLATTHEQREFLSVRQRPYLMVTEEQARDLVAVAGCRRFEDSFAFSMVVEGEQAGERIIDVFTGLRRTHVVDKLAGATVSRAIQVVKRVTTEEGVEDQTLDWNLDGVALVARSDADERSLLGFVNNAFDLRLTAAELEEVLQTGVDERLEALRLEAKAAPTDAERLDIYVGPDDLRDVLPKGLWQALEAQHLVDENTLVADLFLTVYGSDSLRMLADKFRDEGFPDVPYEWAGRPKTISWLRKMGFPSHYAGRRSQPQEDEFIIPGVVKLNPLHPFQEEISGKLRRVLTHRESNGDHQKAMVELPTGAGKTRVAAETVLQLFIDGRLTGSVLWIAQSIELCEQAVQTWSTVWRGLGDERPLTVGRLWEGNVVHEPDTEFGIIVATDAKLDSILSRPDQKGDYDWLSDAAVVIVDEGHRAGGSERYTRILTWLGVAGRQWKRPLVGLSATPFKGTSATATAALVNRFGSLKLNAFNEENAYRRLADIGVLARVRHEVLPGVDVDLRPLEIAEVKQQRMISKTVLERIGRDHARMAILVEHITSLDPAWPVLVFTPDVLSAQVLAATLRYRGIDAAAVSAQTGRQERRDVIERFRKGEIRVLANCDLLIQGFDAPGVRALYIARPTFSPNAYIQMAGRGLRGPANGGKEECLIVDMKDNFGDVTDLLGYREYENLWQEQRA